MGLAKHVPWCTRYDVADLWRWFSWEVSKKSRLDTVYPGNAADFEQRYDDDVKSAGVPVKQSHDVQSCLQYNHIMTSTSLLFHRQACSQQSSVLLDSIMD